MHFYKSLVLLMCQGDFRVRKCAAMRNLKGGKEGLMEDGHDDIQVDDDVSCVLMIDLPSSGLRTQTRSRTRHTIIYIHLFLTC